MNWNTLFSYLIFAESTAVVALGFVFFDKNPPDFALIGKQQKPKTWTEVCWTILKYLVLAPVVAPYLAFKQIRAMEKAKRDMAELEKIKRSHFDLLLNPLSENDIAEDLWTHFEEESTPLIERDYRCLGDFQTKDEPLFCQTRYFLCPCGESLVELIEVLDTRCYELVTFLEDGTVVVSANIEPFDFVEDLAKHQYFVQCLPESDLLGLIEQHKIYVARVCRRCSVGIRELSAERWQAYARYSDRRFSQIKYETGRADAPPPGCGFPRWEPVANEESTKQLLHH